MISSDSLANWRSRFQLAIRTAAPEEAILAADAEVGPLPEELRSFYRVANGLVSGWLEILPVEVAADPRSTWNGLRRANVDSKNHAAPLSFELRERFLAFANIGEGKMALFDRGDGSIWYEEGEELSQTTLDLHGFIEACLREVEDGL